MRLLRWVVRDMFCGLTEDDVVKFYGKKLVLGGEVLEDKVADKYRADASRIKETELWGELVRQVEISSNRKIFEQGKGGDDLFFGRAMVFNLRLIEKLLDLFINPKK